MARQVGEGHPVVANLLRLGRLLLDRGDPEPAPVLRRAVAIRRAVLPPEHPAVDEAGAALAESLAPQSAGGGPEAAPPPGPDASRRRRSYPWRV